MSRRITAFVFLIVAVFISVFASFKVRNICDTTTEKIENIIEVSEIDIQEAKTQTQSVYEYWQKNSSVLQFFVGAQEILDVRLSIYEMLFLLEQENIEGFLEEASNCKKSLFHISDSEKPSFSKIL